MIDGILKDIEKKYATYYDGCKIENDEIEKDFAEIHKFFFTNIENAKSQMKETVKKNQKKFLDKYNALRNNCQELSKKK